jgi:shikimate dehydrogenase
MNIRGSTRLVAVLGWPVEHSGSPAMHNAAFVASGLDFAYVPCAVHPDDLAPAVAGLRALRFAGANVIIPHKQAICRHLDELDESARIVGAVNTIRRVESRLVGYNTDGPGLIRSLGDADCEVEGRRAAIIGAGGAGRAVAWAVARAGAADVAIINRTPSKAEDVARLVNAAVGRDVARPYPLADPVNREVIGRADLIVDTTDVGMYPNVDVPPVVPADWLLPKHVVCDITYNPRETVLLRAARERGARTVDGLGMLVHQGAVGFELWTGEAAPIAFMRGALEAALAAAERRANRSEV